MTALSQWCECNLPVHSSLITFFICGAGSLLRLLQPTTELTVTTAYYHARLPVDGTVPVLVQKLHERLVPVTFTACTLYRCKNQTPVRSSPGSGSISQAAFIASQNQPPSLRNSISKQRWQAQRTNRIQLSWRICVPRPRKCFVKPHETCFETKWRS